MNILRTLLDAFAGIGRFSAFALASLSAAVAAIVRPTWWVQPLYRCVVGAMPLAVVAGLALGLVIWMHTRDVLARSGTGAVEYLPTVLAVAVLLELAPVGAGLILAARTGASLGAEFASMRVGEQIDALATLGISPVRRLVGPHVLGCILAAPLLHASIAVVALASGFVAESFSGGTTLLRFDAAATQQLFLSDVIPAAMKTMVFGFLVGVAGCFVGLNCRGGSEGVGRAATDSVVVCMLLVLAADVLLVAIIKLANELLL